MRTFTLAMLVGLTGSAVLNAADTSRVSPNLHFLGADGQINRGARRATAPSPAGTVLTPSRCGPHPIAAVDPRAALKVHTRAGRFSRRLRRRPGHRGGL